MTRKEDYDENKEKILERKRLYYHANKERICASYRADRVCCPYCIGMTFRRCYLKKHLRRHANVKEIFQEEKK